MLEFSVLFTHNNDKTEMVLHEPVNGPEKSYVIKGKIDSLQHD